MVYVFAVLAILWLALMLFWAKTETDFSRDVKELLDAADD